MVFIPKPGKKGYCDPKSICPISLLSFLAKGLEKILLLKTEDLMRVNPLSTSQHAFKKGYSCESALLTVIDTIESAILRKKLALGVFLDISGAFDNVLPSKIAKAMARKNLPYYVINWFLHFVQERTVITTINGTMVQKEVGVGTPQGGVLSPFIWNLVIDDFLESLEVGPIKAIGFADDVCLIARGSDSKIMNDNMQFAIGVAESWSRESGLSFNASKSAAILFSKHGMVNMLGELKIGGGNINFVEHTKYLGIHLDKNLRF